MRSSPSWIHRGALTVAALFASCCITTAFSCASFDASEQSDASAQSDASVVGDDANSTAPPDASDGGALTDAAGDVRGPCDDACVTGTQCENDRCTVIGAASCAAPIDVGADGGRFRGTMCVDGGPASISFCGANRRAHTFRVPAGAVFNGLMVRNLAAGPMRLSATLGASCPPGGCQGVGGFAQKSASVNPGEIVMVATENEADCVTYELTF